PVRTTAAPSRAKASAAASPMPLPPPVTHTILSTNRLTTRSTNRIRNGRTILAARPRRTLEKADAKDLPDAAAAGRQDARLGTPAGGGPPRARCDRARDYGGSGAGDPAGGRRLRHDPAGSARPRRKAPVAASTAGRTSRRLLLPRTDRTSGRHHQFPRNLQRPHRRAHHELCPRFR